MSFQLTRAYVEYIHDEIVPQRMPFDQPVSPREYRDPDLIESAVARPFQTACGEEVHKTIYEKAAALFHSLACNHCFLNGNKRTALIALDMFLAANEYVFAMSNDDAYELAKRTASHNADGRSSSDTLKDITELLQSYSVPMQALLHESVKDDPAVQKVYASSVRVRNLIVNHPLNQPQG